VRKNALFIIILFSITNCFAQETVVKKDRLTESVIEIYHVLKADKQTKQGLYQAEYNGHSPLASGEYTNGKRTGTWHFYDTYGQIIENFDYDTQTFLYEEPVSEYTKSKIIYGFDTAFTNTDRVTKPMKPGGRCFGYINYLKLYQLSYDLYNINPSEFTGVLELLISPLGRLADIKIHLKSNYFERTTTFSPELIDDDDKLFIPATINNQPVMCRIFLKCRLTAYGELDID
jgi:hypothetical protein